MRATNSFPQSTIEGGDPCFRNANSIKHSPNVYTFPMVQHCLIQQIYHLCFAAYFLNCSRQRINISLQRTGGLKPCVVSFRLTQQSFERRQLTPQSCGWGKCGNAMQYTPNIDRWIEEFENICKTWGQKLHTNNLSVSEALLRANYVSVCLCIYTEDTVDQDCQAEERLRYQHLTVYK